MAFTKEDEMLIKVLRQEHAWLWSEKVSEGICESRLVSVVCD